MGYFWEMTYDKENNAAFTKILDVKNYRDLSLCSRRGFVAQGGLRSLNKHIFN